jgi:hypothetical protein
MWVNCLVAWLALRRREIAILSGVESSDIRR